MKTMTFSTRLLTAGIIATGLLASQGALAASWSDVGPTTGFTIGATTINYSPGAFKIRYYDDNLTPQDPTDVAGYVEAAYGLASGTVGSAVSYCDNPTSGCTNATATSPSTDKFIFTSASAYDYLAIHFGQAELVFHWASDVAANTQFMIQLVNSGSDGLKGLSNFRAYNDPLNGGGDVPGVPLPAAFWMVGAALFGTAGISRRKRHIDA